MGDTTALNALEDLRALHDQTLDLCVLAADCLPQLIEVVDTIAEAVGKPGLGLPAIRLRQTWAYARLLAFYLKRLREVYDLPASSDEEAPYTFSVPELPEDLKKLLAQVADEMQKDPSYNKEK